MESKKMLRDAASFRAEIELLRDEIREGGAEMNLDTEAFLEAISAYVADAFCGNLKSDKQLPDGVWRFAADIIRAGLYYE